MKEFWLIDPEAQTVEVFVPVSNQYRLLSRCRPGETARSKLLKELTAPGSRWFLSED